MFNRYVAHREGVSVNRSFPLMVFAMVAGICASPFSLAPRARRQVIDGRAFRLRRSGYAAPCWKGDGVPSSLATKYARDERRRVACEISGSEYIPRGGGRGRVR